MASAIPTPPDFRRATRREFAAMRRVVRAIKSRDTKIVAIPAAFVYNGEPRRNFGFVCVARRPKHRRGATLIVANTLLRIDGRWSLRRDSGTYQSSCEPWLS